MNMLVLDALVAYIHFLGIILLGFTLFSEAMLFRRDLSLRDAVLLRNLDMVLGISWGIIIGAGLLRLFLFGKGSQFYLDNPVFWVKMGVLATVFLLSLHPMVVFMKWGPTVRSGKAPTVPEAQFRRVRGRLYIESALFLFIPLLATLMARGIGAY